VCPVYLKKEEKTMSKPKMLIMDRAGLNDEIGINHWYLIGQFATGVRSTFETFKFSTARFIPKSGFQIYQISF